MPVLRFSKRLSMFLVWEVISLSSGSSDFKEEFMRELFRPDMLERDIDCDKRLLPSVSFLDLDL